MKNAIQGSKTNAARGTGRMAVLAMRQPAVPLLIIDDFGMRKLPLTAAEELLELIMRRYERASTLVTSNRPVEDWGKLLGDAAAVSAMLDRLLHHGHLLKCGPRSWRTKTGLPEGERVG
jgi:DNA replication protein DnaC